VRERHREVRLAAAGRAVEQHADGRGDVEARGGGGGRDVRQPHLVRVRVRVRVRIRVRVRVRVRLRVRVSG